MTTNRPAATPVAGAGRNRLGDETSPYLLQHKSNPVHWWPWGPEAFAAAERLERPIFLSIGYSTCYWCHVMERESFENEAIAAIMNEHFVCIKVDREERPDVDDIYMAAVQLMTGSGGWPMSVFLEPGTLRPFFAGTYFPPEDRYGRAGFATVLQQIADIWTGDRDRVRAVGVQIRDAVAEHLTLRSAVQPVGAAQIDRARSQLLAMYDRTHAGFGGAPKFPVPANLDFLVAVAWDDAPVRDAVRHTLDRMAMGGIYDQIGGGFHRYSTDDRWLVPHFEKMLYDNAQLAATYARVFERTADDYYAEVVRETLDYVMREMTSPEGAFFTAQDAEVNHREGGNYVWVDGEVRTALRDAGLDDDVDFVLHAYGFDSGTNFQDPHHPEDGRKNVVHLADKPAALAASMAMPLDAFNERLARVNDVLKAVRDTRDQPLTDDKVIAGWNGLMIEGMAEGGRVLDEPRFVEGGRRAAAFILSRLRTPEGGLLRTYREGRAKIPAFLEDYAFVIRGLVALHRATGDPAFRDQAIEIAEAARTRFWDTSAGGYFDTLEGQSDLFVRVKSTYDGAVPCGNSVMLGNLLDLHELTGDEHYLDDAVATVEALSGVLAERPNLSVLTLAAIHRMAGTHPDRLASIDSASAPEQPADGRMPVEITASPSTLRLDADAEATLEVTLRLAEGYHVNAHEPGIEYLIPLGLAVAGSGIEITVEYPEGEPFDGPEGRMFVHHDTVTLPLRVRRTGDLTTPPQIVLTYQLCTDMVCLAPQTEPLSIEIEE